MINFMKVNLLIFEAFLLVTVKVYLYNHFIIEHYHFSLFWYLLFETVILLWPNIYSQFWAKRKITIKLNEYFWNLTIPLPRHFALKICRLIKYSLYITIKQHNLKIIRSIVVRLAWNWIICFSQNLCKIFYTIFKIFFTNIYFYSQVE